jgi:hypothetical protein
MVELPGFFDFREHKYIDSYYEVARTYLFMDPLIASPTISRLRFRFKAPTMVNKLTLMEYTFTYPSSPVDYLLVTLFSSPAASNFYDPIIQTD